MIAMPHSHTRDRRASRIRSQTAARCGVRRATLLVLCLLTALCLGSCTLVVAQNVPPVLSALFGGDEGVAPSRPLSSSDELTPATATTTAPANPQIAAPLVGGFQAYDPSSLGGAQQQQTASADTPTDSSESSTATLGAHPSPPRASVTPASGAPLYPQQQQPEEDGEQQVANEPSTQLSWDLAEGSACSLNPGVDAEPRYCEPGLVSLWRASG